MGLLGDFLSGVDDRPYPEQPEPLHLPLILKLEQLVYDGDGNLIGVTDDVIESLTASIPKFEDSRGLILHDWSIFFPPTMHETYASTIVECMVTRRR